MVDLSLFRSRTFDRALAILLLGMATIGGIYLFVTQYLGSAHAPEPVDQETNQTGSQPEASRENEPATLLAGD